MAGISSKAAGKGLDCVCGNKKGYNGNEIQAKEFFDGSGLDIYDFNARTYDQQIGRFIQIDPSTEDAGQDALTPYHFSGNNPSTFNDPDGKCPWCIVGKIVVGALVEYGSQVYDNYQSGKTGVAAWKPTSLGKIALNGVTSAADPSGGLGKRVAINTTTNVVESVGGQLIDNKGVTLNKTVTDVLVMSVSGVVKVDGSKTVNKLEKNADKLERVAKNSPSARNGVQATEARASANGANRRNQTAETATTETTESALGKKVKQINFGDGTSVKGFNPNTPRIDNTGRKPILLPLGL